MLQISQNGITFIKGNENTPLLNYENSLADPSSLIPSSLAVKLQSPRKEAWTFGYGVYGSVVNPPTDYFDRFNLWIYTKASKNTSGIPQLPTLQGINTVFQTILLEKRKNVLARNVNLVGVSLNPNQIDALYDIVWVREADLTQKFTSSSNLLIAGQSLSSLIKQDPNSDLVRQAILSLPPPDPKNPKGSYARRQKQANLYFKQVTSSLPVTVSSSKVTSADSNSDQSKLQEVTRMPGYFVYTHTDSFTSDITSIISAQGWTISPGRVPTIQEVLQEPQDLKGFKSNRESLLDNYVSTSSNGGYYSVTRDGQWVKVRDGQQQNYVPLGAKLIIPLAWITPETIFFKSNGLISSLTNYEGFVTSRMKNLLSLASYRRTYGDGQNIEKRFQSISVWIWCRALQNDFNLLDTVSLPTGKLIDVSPFIMNCTVASTPAGVSFSLSLPPLTVETDISGKWRVAANYSAYGSNEGPASYYYKDAVFYQNDSQDTLRNSFFFSTVLQRNDLVLIRMEKLDVEGNRDPTFSPSMEVPGGVDAIPNNVQPSSNDPNVPQVISPGLSYNSSPFWHNRADGGTRVYDTIGLIDTPRITYNAQGVDVGITITGQSVGRIIRDDSTYFLNLPVEDPKRAGGVLVNSNDANKGRALRRYATSSENNPVEFLARDYSKPSLARVVTAIFSYYACIEVLPEDVFRAYPASRVSWYSTFDPISNQVKTFRGAGIWQIIRVIIDSSISDREIIDPSLPVYEGTLQGGLMKYIQQPFAELLEETIEDLFYFIIRKVPFDKMGYFSLAKLAYSTSQTVDDVEVGALMIDESVVISESLSFYSGPIHSTFTIQPLSSMPSTLEVVNAGSVYPAVFFREYAETWGNSIYSVRSMYLNEAWVRDGATLTQEQIKARDTTIRNDLKFLVESNMYLPFTREGTITIRGDRRIKRGLCIIHTGLREIFYVDSVTNTYSSSASLDRITILQVSRGMRYRDETELLNLLNGNLPDDSILAKYFQIVDYNERQDSPTAPLKAQTNITTQLNVFFDTDKATIISPPPINLRLGDVMDYSERVDLATISSNSIDSVVDELISNPTLKVKIIGYTDSFQTSRPGGNKKLSSDRAYNIALQISTRFLQRTGTKEFLSPLGIRVMYVGKGPRVSTPGSETTVEQRQDNRRCDIEFIYQPANLPNPTPTSNPKEYNWTINQPVLSFFLKKQQFSLNLSQSVINDLNKARKAKRLLSEPVTDKLLSPSDIAPENLAFNDLQ